MAVVGRHRGGRDQHAALAGGFGLVLGHRVGRQADHVEAADQVHGDGLAEHRQRVRAVLADGLLGRRDAGAVDQADQLAELQRGRHHGLAVLLADIALDEHATDLMHHGLALFDLHVGDDHFAAVGGQHSHGAFTQPRSSAGNDECLTFDIHWISKSLLSTEMESLLGMGHEALERSVLSLDCKQSRAILIPSHSLQEFAGLRSRQVLHKVDLAWTLEMGKLRPAEVNQLLRKRF